MEQTKAKCKVKRSEDCVSAKSQPIEIWTGTGAEHGRTRGKKNGRNGESKCTDGERGVATITHLLRPWSAQAPLPGRSISREAVFASVSSRERERGRERDMTLVLTDCHI